MLSGFFSVHSSAQARSMTWASFSGNGMFRVKVDGDHHCGESLTRDDCMRPHATGKVVGFLPNLHSPKSEPSTCLPPAGVTSEVFPRPLLSPLILSPVSSVEERWIGSLECIAQNDSDRLMVTLQVRFWINHEWSVLSMCVVRPL